MRLKGLGFMLSTQNVAQAFNQWVNPVALTPSSGSSASGSQSRFMLMATPLIVRSYIVYIALEIIYLVLIYLFFPETK